MTDGAHPPTEPAPLVSVLLPVHNGGAFLAEALDSVLSQTLGDLEVIAVENGSTDGSLRVLRDRAALDDRLRVIDAGPVGLVAPSTWPSGPHAADTWPAWTPTTSPIPGASITRSTI